MAAKEEDRRSDLAVMDANEYKQKRRLQRILDAHDKVEDKADEAYELYVTGQISESAKDIMLLRSVQEYIREIYNLLNEYDRQLKEEDEESVNGYWQGRELGSIQFEHGEDIVFKGLQSVLYADKFYTEMWTEGHATRHGPSQTETKYRQHTVPEEVSWNAYLLVNEFLSEEKDVEIRFEELKNELPSWGFIEVTEDGEEIER